MEFRIFAVLLISQSFGEITHGGYNTNILTGLNEELFESAGYPKTGDVPVLNRKIYKGFRVSIQEHPYIVSIRRLCCHYLTAALLTYNIVISIAHPIYMVPIYELSVVAGETYSDRGTNLHSVLIVIIHEAFNPYTLEADLALIRVYEEFVFRVSIKPISMVSPTFNLSNRRAFVTGWGRCDMTDRQLCLPRTSKYFPDEKIDAILRSVSFIIKPQNYYCEGYKLHETYIHSGILCLGTAREEEPVTPCIAVPGAPLVVNARLAGFLSWGFGCGYNNDLPLIYIDLRHYEPWLVHNIPVIRNLSRYNLTEMFETQRAYILTQWLTSTRGNVSPLKLNYPENDMYYTELDIKLATLIGTVFDIRDFMYNSTFREVKTKMYRKIKDNLITTRQEESRNLKDVINKISQPGKPFLNKHILTNEDYFELTTPEAVDSEDDMSEKDVEYNDSENNSYYNNLNNLE